MRKFSPIVLYPSSAVLFFSVFSVVGLPAQSSGQEPEKRIEIFTEGKKYNSIEEYRKRQVDRLKPPETPPEEGVSKESPDTKAEEIARALASALPGMVSLGTDNPVLNAMLQEAAGTDKDVPAREEAPEKEVGAEKKDAAAKKTSPSPLVVENTANPPSVNGVSYIKSMESLKSPSEESDAFKPAP